MQKHLIINRLFLIFTLFVMFNCSEAAQQSLEKIQFSADHVDFKGKEGIGYYRGHVRVTQGQTLITSESAKTIHGANNTLLVAIAYGSRQQPAYYQTQLKPKEPLLKAHADMISYHVTTHQVELKGHAQVVQGQHSVKAPLIVYDMLQQRIVSNNGFYAQEVSP